jgi:glycosyltransferase involved in cell wall biosynthesis
MNLSENNMFFFNKNIITFIIPTIGRESLNNSIKSLLNQTIKNWKAIIIFDGIKSNIDINDERIKIIEIDKIGKDFNSAGEVRNYGMKLVETKWIAFLDDDDIIAHDYIDFFYKELYINDKLDVLIYRMKLGERIIPKLDTDNFYICDVGISYIIKTNIYLSGLKFIPDSAEDFLYLNLIRENNYNIIISPYIKYFVRQSKYDIIDLKIIGKRIFIYSDNDFLKKNINNNILLIGYYLYNKFM